MARFTSALTRYILWAERVPTRVVANEGLLQMNCCAECCGCNLWISDGQCIQNWQSVVLLVLVIIASICVVFVALLKFLTSCNIYTLSSTRDCPRREKMHLMRQEDRVPFITILHDPEVTRWQGRFVACVGFGKPLRVKCLMWASGVPVAHQRLKK